MVDYTLAFKKGLDAAEAAERAKKEIDSVFEDLDMQVCRAAEGKISIKRKEFEVKPTAWDWAKTLSDFITPRGKETYWAIVAYNPKITDSQVKELARWKQGRGGYPCKISFGGTDCTCEDKEGLENTLGNLLSDPMVGENLRLLMQLQEEKTVESDSGDKE